METIRDIISAYAEYQAEVNFLFWVGAIAMFAGTLLIYRLKGRRLREALSEWTRLFEDLDKRVAELTRELIEVRQQLVEAQIKAQKAQLENVQLRHDEMQMKNRIARLETRVRELENDLAKREKELKEYRNAE